MIFSNQRRLILKVVTGLLASTSLPPNAFSAASDNNPDLAINTSKLSDLITYCGCDNRGGWVIHLSDKADLTQLENSIAKEFELSKKNLPPKEEPKKTLRTKLHQLRTSIQDFFK